MNLSVGKGDGVAELREIFAEFIDGRQMVIFATFRALSQRRRQLLLQVGDRVIAFADSGDVLGDDLIAFVTFRRQVGYFAFSSASCF
ncbi:hypothetical protein M8494_14610 [Serratia ureilytica]